MPLVSLQIRSSIQLVLTISGTENRYSRFIQEISHVSSIRFFRFLSRDELIHLYSKSSLMIFTSRIETLGLPLYEYMQFMKPILAPNHPYATEALSSYSLAHIYDFSSLSSGADCLRHIAFRSRDSAPAPIAPSPVPDSPDDFKYNTNFVAIFCLLHVPPAPTCYAPFSSFSLP